MKYGPLVLAPHVLYWGHDHKESHDNTIPDGYVPTKLPGSSVKLLVSPSADSGFLKLSSSPLPAWSYFEMGPESPLSIEGASAYVPVELESGEKQTLWFAPLCHATSNQSFYDTPIVFSA